MPRTLPAALATVMDAGIYEPYIKIIVSEDRTAEVTVDSLGYTLGPLSATVKIAKFNEDNGVYAHFRIVRGAVISGTPSTISSIWFRTDSITYDGKLVTLTGKPLSTAYKSIAADSTYQEVIDSALAEITNFGVTYEGTAAWKGYQFYPAGKAIVLNGLMKLFTLLRQKYLVFATENGFDGTNSNFFFFCATDTRAQDYTFVDLLFNVNHQTAFRKLIWRDEANTVHTNGSGTNPIHNLGYLESTASAPPNANGSYIGSHSSKLPVHLKYRTGDYVSNTNAGLNGFTGRINVTEVLDLKSTPAWYMIIEKFNWFGSTEGGPMPSTIEAAAPYTPLATGNFDNVLSSNDNNVQAAFETLDEHGHQTAGDARYAQLGAANTLTGVNSFTNTADSTSSSTGAVKISGGLGVAKNIVLDGLLGIGANPAYKLDGQVAGGADRNILRFAVTAISNGFYITYTHSGTIVNAFLDGQMSIGNPTGGLKGYGTLNAQAVYDDGTILTDFVFEPSYKLVPIPDMKKFYETFLHLPTIPGKDEWDNKGSFSLGKLVTHLWETIEVQARYIAELDERLRQLENK